jgi:hypothetical protein
MICIIEKIKIMRGRDGGIDGGGGDDDKSKMRMGVQN